MTLHTAKTIELDGSPIPTVELIDAGTITPEPVRWLWQGWIARGKLHVIAGAPGTGKTTIALSLIASVTTCKPFPDGRTPTEPGRVLVWSGEDDPADTLVPRLLAAGADLARVQFAGLVTEDGERYPFDPARDIPILAAALAGCDDVAMILIDPLVSAIAGDSHKNAEVRRGLQPLVDLAQRVDAALVGITHYSKGTQGRDPLERVTGSVAFAALARAVFGTVRQQSEDAAAPPSYLFARVKCSNGPDGGGFGYAFGQVDIGSGITANRVTWGAAVQGTARDLIGAAEVDPDDDGQDAVRLLRDLLANGPMPTKTVQSEAREAGIPWRTVQRAMRRAGVESHRQGFGMPALWARKDHPDSGATPNDGATGANGATDQPRDFQRGATDAALARIDGDPSTVAPPVAPNDARCKPHGCPVVPVAPVAPCFQGGVTGADGPAGIEVGDL